MGDPTMPVPRWEPQDVPFRSRRKHPNPFRVPFAARVRGPGGRAFTIPGFYGGRGTWKVRVSPTEEGRWTLTTRSGDPQLDGRTVSFECVPNASPFVYGGLRVDGEHPHHFVFEDGSRSFQMGYECDWLWALDMGKPDLPTLEPFLDTLAAHGFNHLILNAYAHDCPWRKGTTGPDDYGPPPKFAWRGSNARPDHSRLNLAYWRHYDRVIAALRRRGIVAHVMIKVYNKMVSWPRRGGPDDDLYFRWLVARYAAFPNVVWDFSKEANNEPSVRYKQGRLRLLRDLDPYRRLLTVHDDSRTYDAGAYNDLLDFRSDQQHSDWHATVLRQRRQIAWPVVNVEFGYEHGPDGPDDLTYRVGQPPEEVARRAWEICLAGGYVAYYYTYTAWDVVRPGHVPPGYAHFRRLREFFEGTRYWELEPRDDLVTAGHCLAAPGREYVVFLDEAATFALRLRRTAGPLAGEWFHPLTGTYRRVADPRAGRVRFAPPPDWHGGPVVLHIGARPDFRHRGGSLG